VAALQEAGMLGVNPLANWPRSPMFGIYPTVESMAAQGAMILLLATGFLWSNRRAPAAA
jgi:high-affinity iron transporter